MGPWTAGTTSLDLNLLTMHSEAENIEVAAYEVQGYLRQLCSDL